MVLDGVLRAIDALAWPVTVLILAFLFRGGIRGILEDISSFRAGRFEAHLEERMTVAKHQLREHKGSSDSALHQLGETEPEQIAALSRIDPSAAILRVWMDIEEAVRERYQDEEESSVPVYELISTRLRQEKPHLSDAIHTLRTIRNDVAHNPDYEPDGSMVDEYRNMAEEVMDEIEG